jgi:hypothetical protein
MASDLPLRLSATHRFPSFPVPSRGRDGDRSRCRVAIEMGKLLGRSAAGFEARLDASYISRAVITRSM